MVNLGVSIKCCDEMLEIFDIRVCNIECNGISQLRYEVPC